MLLFAAACSGHDQVSEDQNVFTAKVRSQLDRFAATHEPATDASISMSIPATKVQVLDVDEFVASFKPIAKELRASRANTIASGTFDSDRWDDKNAALLTELEAWITEWIGRAQPSNREYLVALMWALRHPPPAFETGLEDNFGPTWFEDRFDEVYDEYYLGLATTWLNVNSASRPASLKIGGASRLRVG
ncbi:hypothetical protein [Candidatus Poriferisodalis sp.]|uniref:hypothetical protein n=1 Tax=Candidatus Poriferisodalis sp. TaxID=3101277 RepID=UPI003B022CFE